VGAPVAAFGLVNSRHCQPKTTGAASVPIPQCGELSRRRALSGVRHSVCRNLGMRTWGACSGVFMIWSDVQLKRRSSALVMCSRAVRRTTTASSKPAFRRLDNLRWSAFIPAWCWRSESLDSGWGWRSRWQVHYRGAEGKSDASLSIFRCRIFQIAVSRRRRARALGFGWLTDRIGARNVLHHARALSHATAATAYRELSQASAVSVPDRGGHRWRIHRDQFDDPELVPARYRGWTDL